MQLKHAQRIVKAAENFGENLSLRDSYRGRGMTSPTSGVVGSRSIIIKAVAAAAANLALLCDSEEEINEFVDDMDVSFDNMGLDYIAY
jgi:hypothetical protein